MIGLSSSRHSALYGGANRQRTNRSGWDRAILARSLTAWRRLPQTVQCMPPIPLAQGGPEVAVVLGGEVDGSDAVGSWGK